MRWDFPYTDSLVTIPYKHNSLRIEYNVNSNDASQSALFSYRLSEGSERGEWSEYSENTIKEFTGLHEGKYVFSVKLMTDKDQELVMTSFSFEILPPWYRTWWSYLIYAVAVGLLLYYIAYRIAVSRKHLLMQKELELYRQKQEFKKESELKDQKILSGGGIFAKSKVLQSGFNKDYFITIDIREVTEIPLFSPKAQLKSNHPQGSYQFDKDEDGNLTLKITDVKQFWSLGKYLVIEVG